MHNKDQQIKKLSEHNDELENYFRNTIIPQLFVDAKLTLQKFTPPAMKQFNLSPKDLGKPIIDIKDNIRYPTIVEDIKQVIKSKDNLEKDIQTTDLRWYQMNIIPYIKQEDNTANGVIITFVETTARINGLKEQEKLISEHEILLDTISHDIKSPLTSLLLTIQQIKQVSIKDFLNLKSLFNILQNSIKKIQLIITELTDSRKQQHKDKTEEELSNFESILEDVHLLIASNIVESGVVIKSKLNVTEIHFSRRKLRSIIYNLVNNAIKFKSPHRKPEIFIKTTREKNYIVISVKDNGIGIEKSKQESIFKKYFRLENDIEGSGIGLYLANEIVTTSGGKIILNSQPGKGSEFKVYIKKKVNNNNNKLL
jgi:two-component system, OmpR family, phosphate regulon sensor histidine kinase PhoR